MNKSYVLDSFALLAHLEGEKRGEFIHKILLEAQARETLLFMSVINLGEIYYIICREKGVAEADGILTLIRMLPIEIVDSDLALTIEAAKLKAHHPIAYADCFAAALALHLDSVVITGDLEFKQLNKKIHIHWL